MSTPTREPDDLDKMADEANASLKRLVRRPTPANLEAHIEDCRRYHRAFAGLPEPTPAATVGEG